MQLLIMYAHPNPKSFNRALLDVLLEEIKKRGHAYELHDLYQMKFNPVLAAADFEAFNRGETPKDITFEQAAVKKADMIFFMHPVWWFGIPGILKGWIERVFSYGFAYEYGSNGVRGKLLGKKSVIINTTGGSEATYAAAGFRDAYLNITDNGIYRFVGMEIILHRLFFEVPTISQEARTKVLETLREDLAKII